MTDIDNAERRAYYAAFPGAVPPHDDMRWEGWKARAALQSAQAPAGEAVACPVCGNGKVRTDFFTVSNDDGSTFVQEESSCDTCCTLLMTPEQVKRNDQRKNAVRDQTARIAELEREVADLKMSAANRSVSGGEASALYALGEARRQLAEAQAKLADAEQRGYEQGRAECVKQTHALYDECQRQAALYPERRILLDLANKLSALPALAKSKEGGS